MGQTVAIICNGEFPKTPAPLQLIKKADRIICCDGALSTFLRKSKKIFGETRLPDITIGDMDSLSPSRQKKFRDAILRVAEQDHNDMTKAFTFVMHNIPDVSTIHFIAATGKREDHTIGNIALLMEYCKMFDLSKIQLDITSDYSHIFPITDTCSLPVGKNRQISIFSPDNSLTITSQGLKWRTDSVIFDNWWKATLNQSEADTVTLTFSHPSSAIIILS